MLFDILRNVMVCFKQNPLTKQLLDDPSQAGHMAGIYSAGGKVYGDQTYRGDGVGHVIGSGFE
jgi:hypothetical protein